MKSSKRVLVLNQSYQPITLITVKKAITLFFRDKVDFVELSENIIHSPSSSLNAPLIVRLKFPIRYSPFGRVELNKRNLFRRDGFKCAYCGSDDNLTMDHIVPKSRGGQSNWENLVTACHPCNNRKDNKLLEDVGYTLSVKPRQPNQLMFLTHNTKVHDKWKPYLYMK